MKAHYLITPLLVVACQPPQYPRSIDWVKYYKPIRKSDRGQLNLVGATTQGNKPQSTNTQSSASKSKGWDGWTNLNNKVQYYQGECPPGTYMNAMQGCVPIAQYEQVYGKGSFSGYLTNADNPTKTVNGQQQYLYHDGKYYSPDQFGGQQYAQQYVNQMQQYEQQANAWRPQNEKAIQSYTQQNNLSQQQFQQWLPQNWNNWNGYLNQQIPQNQQQAYWSNSVYGSPDQRQNQYIYTPQQGSQDMWNTGWIQQAQPVQEVWSQYGNSQYQYQ